MLNLNLKHLRYFWSVASHGSRMVQKYERIISSCFTIVEIEHTPKALFVLDRII